MAHRNRPSGNRTGEAMQRFHGRHTVGCVLYYETLGLTQIFNIRFAAVRCSQVGHCSSGAAYSFSGCTHLFTMWHANMLVFESPLGSSFVLHSCYFWSPNSVSQLLNISQITLAVFTGSIAVLLLPLLVCTGSRVDRLPTFPRYERALLFCIAISNLSRQKSA